MEIKNDILWRVILMYVLICLAGICIIAKVCTIQFREGDKWRAKAQALTTKYINIDAVRGNIFASDGSLLATSLPFYEVGMDVNTDFLSNLPDATFSEKADSLAAALSMLLKNKSKHEYYRSIIKARKSHDRYIQLGRNVSYNQLQEMKKLPLLRLGRNKGGFVYLQTSKRERPFKILAARTIGYEREDIKPIGLEGAYNEQLKGTGGQRLMQKIAGGVWMPINEENEIEPEDGCDLVSTIDINIQDVAEHALLKQLIKNKAGYGCVVLMEVKTGEVKAIANLSRKDSATYYESYNYAIGAATEPGSTLKLASLISAMEDGYVDLNDMVDLENGTHKYFDRVMKDSHEPAIRNVTVQRVFEISSNVGVSKIITQYYSKNPQKFIDHLYKMNLNSPLGLSIPGEGIPQIKKAFDKDWSGTSLPWMAIGYEILITPMQTLSLYNAIANNGKMVRPRFVKEIRKRGKTIKTFEPQIINPAICSESTVEKAKKMLEGVVLNGTALNLKAASYSIAGKTGTAQIANKGIYKNGSTVSYQASFVGYFPAENPMYSCIVIVNAPSNGVYYGNVVAGPIFKEIADKVYAGSLEIHKEINPPSTQYVTRAPSTKSGYQKDIQTVLKGLNIPITSDNENAEWSAEKMQDSSKVQLIANTKIETDLKNQLVPNVVGMDIQDALYLLENKGLQVKINGSGVVVKQSVEPGTKFTKGLVIELKLS